MTGLGRITVGRIAVGRNAAGGNAHSPDCTTGGMMEGFGAGGMTEGLGAWPIVGEGEGDSMDSASEDRGGLSSWPWVTGAGPLALFGEATKCTCS